jgi:fructokinase
MNRMIIVAGEALIDRIIQSDGRLLEVPGGAPYNTARTIARLGGRVAFLGGLSADRAGRRLRAALEADGVDLRWAVETEAPTTYAIAHIDAAGAAEYRFELSGTSAADVPPGAVDVALAARPDALFVGGLGLVAQPIAGSLDQGIVGLDPGALLMVDPNCRPAAIDDRAAYVARLGGVLARADVIKVSGDDLGYLEPGRPPLEAAGRLVGDRPAVVLLTDGARAVHVLAATFSLNVPVAPAEVVDTIGAGDAFGGAFLAWLVERGGRAGLDDGEVVRDAVERAVGVAAITCQRSGADPPWRNEVGWPER